jgi:hypothetical protein
VHVLLDALIDKAKPSGDSGEPVEDMTRTVERSWVSIGRSSALRNASMNFADVPK